MKVPRLSFLLPRCSLSYSKIVQGERSAKRKTRFLICTSEPQPILGLKHPTLPLMGATRLASGKMLLFFSKARIFLLYPDAGRVAPISACVFYQTDRLKSKFEAKERTVVPGHCALMEATRLASSGHFSAASGRVAPIRGSVWSTNTQNAGKIKTLYKVFSFARNNHYNNYTSCKTRCKNTYAYALSKNKNGYTCEYRRYRQPG